MCCVFLLFSVSEDRMQTEDILICPGPNELADRVIRAMMRPAACPAFEEFQEFYEQTLDMLAQVFQTTNQVVPLPGSGRSGLEAAITSVLEPGDRTLTIVTGYFGELAIRIANGLGGKAEALGLDRTELPILPYPEGGTPSTIRVPAE